jgi:hypothetical protein
LIEELVVAQATTQPRNATPIDTTKNNKASSRVQHDELLLDQATMQPRNENPVNVTTDNNDITINASTTRISNEESIEEPVVSCLDMYHTNVLMYCTMVLLASPT